MTQLSVNVNKIALLRNSRGRNFPDLLAFSARFLDLGAAGITLHPRPDQRHARYDDVAPLQRLCAERGITAGTSNSTRRCCVPPLRN